MQRIWTPPASTSFLFRSIRRCLRAGRALEFDCSRIFGLLVERSWLRAMMESAREEPIGAGTFSAIAACGFTSRRSKPMRHLVHSIQSAVGTPPQS
jgi:hypothetical protein